MSGVPDVQPAPKRARVVSVFYVRVEVENPSFRALDTERWRREVQDVEREIRRHVDGFSSTRIEAEYACADCGSRWGEASDRYNGGCCDADEARKP